MKILISTFNIFNIINRRNSFCGQSGNYKCGSCPEIRRTDTGTRIPGNSVNDCGISLNLDIRTHSGKLVHILKPVLENTLGHNTRSLGKPQCNRNLRLHIRRESRIGKCLYMRMGKRFRCHNTYGIIRFLDFTSDFKELCADGL